jgi:hypothetical protein
MLGTGRDSPDLQPIQAIYALPRAEQLQQLIFQEPDEEGYS